MRKRKIVKRRNISHWFCKSVSPNQRGGPLNLSTRNENSDKNCFPLLHRWLCFVSKNAARFRISCWLLSKMFSLYLKCCQQEQEQERELEQEDRMKVRQGQALAAQCLFVIATKLDVFLQLTPEMQTHLPQPLNRISTGIRTSLKGTKDADYRNADAPAAACLWTRMCLCMCAWQAAVVAHERVRKAKVLFSFSRYTRKSSQRLTLELTAGGHCQLTQSLASKWFPICVEL